MPSEPPNGITVTAITPEDLPVVVTMLEALAEYEEAGEPIRSTVETLRAAMFGSQPRLFGFIARRRAEPAGMIIGYETYATFAAKPRLFIEDLFVRAECRGSGIGRALIAALARRCIDRGYGEVHWRVLDRNEPGIRLYRSIGALISNEHRNCSLTGQALEALADNPAPALRFADSTGRLLGPRGVGRT
jgi:ribosomal protein S18 acetylase RimI-like enzyme